jgi:hypothetical protein
MPVRNVSTLRRSALTSLLACALVASWATDALAAVTCKPILSIKNVRELRTTERPVQPWTWKATIVADASYCATRSGDFEIDFIRIKEYSLDVQFTEKYRWSSGQIDVSMELAADESILDYRIGFIAPCVCREIPYDD